MGEMYEKQTVSSLGGSYKLNHQQFPGTRAVKRISLSTEAFLETENSEIADLLPRMSLKALSTIQALYESYGERLYSSILLLSRSPKPEAIHQLEEDVLSGKLEQLLENAKIKENRSQVQAFGPSEEFGGTMNLLTDDLDFLDALASHDVTRLNTFSSNQESLSAIFSEIVENEHQATSNYQDEVFEKNIQRIFNAEIDLDNLPSQDPLHAAANFPNGRDTPMKPMTHQGASLDSNSAFRKQIGYYSFFTPASEKKAKSGIYYTTLWMGIAAATLAFSWLFVR